LGGTSIDTNGNFSLDPLFCHPDTGNYNIYDNSPCAPENNSCSTLIGAYEVNCTCCTLRGDVATDANGYVLVNDLIYLVDYLFNSGPAPSCPEEGDCAVPLDGLILINDLVYLVDFLFKGGPAPPEC